MWARCLPVRTADGTTGGNPKFEDPEFVLLLFCFVFTAATSSWPFLWRDYSLSWRISAPLHGRGWGVSWCVILEDPHQRRRRKSLRGSRGMRALQASPQGAWLRPERRSHEDHLPHDGCQHSSCNSSPLSPSEDYPSAQIVYHSSGDDAPACWGVTASSHQYEASFCCN